VTADALGRFAAGDVALQSGITLPGVECVYATYGKLSPARDNVIVYPTRFGGAHADNEFLIGPDHALDPRRHFVVVPNMLGNGVSTSPSGVAAPHAGAHFPLVTVADNVRLQHRLLREVFDVQHVRLAVGWSMGGQQAYHWAALYPELVERLAVICGAARTTPHTHVFLEGMRSALCADPAWSGDGAGPPPLRGLRAVGRAWAGWALSQAWYRRKGWEQLGYATLEDFLVRYWEATYLGRDAGNLVAMIRTWQACDVADNDIYGGDFAAAMKSIRARAVIMPGLTDLYFPPEDSEAEVALLRDGTLEVIPSDWGHYAGGGRDPADTAFIDRQLAALLAR
jgi:homoserine O-acetyltransferase/O-succinyltransferase